LNPEKCLKFNQSEGRLWKPEHPNRTREILKFLARTQWENIGWNKEVMSKKSEKGRIRQVSKVSTLDIEINRSGLNVSNSKALLIKFSIITFFISILISVSVFLVQLSFWFFVFKPTCILLV